MSKLTQKQEAWVEQQFQSLFEEECIAQLFIVAAYYNNQETNKQETNKQENHYQARESIKQAINEGHLDKAFVAKKVKKILRVKYQIKLYQWKPKGEQLI